MCYIFCLLPTYGCACVCVCVSVSVLSIEPRTLCILSKKNKEVGLGEEVTL